MKHLKPILFLFLLISTLVLSGCTLTPHANVGVDLTMQNGKLKLHPNANIGVWGTPSR